MKINTNPPETRHKNNLLTSFRTLFYIQNARFQERKHRYQPTAKIRDGSP